MSIFPPAPALSGPRPSPVAVIGSGPVGQTTALLLARWGVPTLLLDSRPQRIPVGSKAICQSGDVLDIWDFVGAGRPLADAGLTWTTARTFYRDQEIAAWSFPDDQAAPFPSMVNVSQSTTERVLDERIAAQPLIRQYWGWHVTGIDQDDHGVRLSCDTPGGRETLQVPYAVACGGARSDDLRSILGLDFPGETFAEKFLICDIRVNVPGWKTERRYYFDPAWNPDRQVLIQPCPDGVYRIDWQVDEDFDLETAKSTGAIDSRLRRIVGDAPFDIVWTSLYRFHARCVDRLLVDRVLLAGDCAHLVPPFGARGLNSGVQDAENAAWKLAAVLHRWAPASLLESYHIERRAAAQENIDVARATMRFTTPQTPQEWQERRARLNQARDDRAAASRIDSGRFAEPFWYVDSPLTTSHPELFVRGRPPKGQRPRAAPGVLIRDGWVSDPDHGERTTVRRLVRGRLSILTTRPLDDEDNLAATLSRRVPMPHHFLRLDALRTAELAKTIEITDEQCWVVRPDGHIGAILDRTDTEGIVAAAQRVIGRHRPGTI